MEQPSATTSEGFNFHIPFDLFVSKKRGGLGTRGFLQFSDSAGNLVYRVHKSSHESTDHLHPQSIKLVLDSSGNTLFSVHRVNKDSWQGFRGNNSQNKIVKVERTLEALNRSEFKILLVGENNNEDSKAELTMKGCPFNRACTIYKGNSIAAESSLMYKLGFKKMFVPRNRFRVTIFPGFTDHVLLVSLIVMFFDGRKIWI